MIDILLATYNGEKYLEPQIYSIIYQTYKDWTLYIHDDGSSDNTINIIRRFSERYSNIVYVEDDKKHLGPGANFMHLLNSSKAELVCFCDQDDLWLENKLEVMAKCFESVDSESPMVVYSQARDYFSNNHNYIGRYSYSCKHFTIRDSLFKNGGIQGCAAMFNAAMRDFINIEHTFVAMHDQILMLAGIVTGGIRYIDDVLFLYRQHNSNTTTHQPQSALESLGLIKNFNIPVIEKPYYEGLLSFYNAYKCQISERDKKLFELYFGMPKRDRFSRIFIILIYRFPFSGSVIKLVLKNILRKYYIK